MLLGLGLILITEIHFQHPPTTTHHHPPPNITNFFDMKERSQGFKIWQVSFSLKNCKIKDAFYRDPT